MELQPDQVYAQLGELVFGAVDFYGVDWALRTLDGWAGASATTRRSAQRPRQGGSWVGRGYPTGRSIALGGMIYAPTAADLSLAIDRLNTAAEIDSALLTVIEAGRARWCRVGRSDDVITKWVSPTEASWSVQVEAADWRKFGADVMDATALPSTFGGLLIGGGSDGSTATSFTPEQFSSMANQQGYTTNTSGTSGSMELYNADGTRSDAIALAVVADTVDAFTIPFSIEAVTVTGQVSLVNPGNETGPVRLRIDGPCRGPVVTHVSSGAQLVFSSSLVLGAGEWIDVDMEARTVLANGQASRAPWITSRGWAGFTPGENTWAFTAAAFDADARLTVVATPSWK